MVAKRRVPKVTSHSHDSHQSVAVGVQSRPFFYLFPPPASRPTSLLHIPVDGPRALRSSFGSFGTAHRRTDGRFLLGWLGWKCVELPSWFSPITGNTRKTHQHTPPPRPGPSHPIPSIHPRSLPWGGWTESISPTQTHIQTSTPSSHKRCARFGTARQQGKQGQGG